MCDFNIIFCSGPVSPGGYKNRLDEIGIALLLINVSHVLSSEATRTVDGEQGREEPNISKSNTTPQTRSMLCNYGMTFFNISSRDNRTCECKPSS